MIFQVSWFSEVEAETPQEAANIAAKQLTSAQNPLPFLSVYEEMDEDTVVYDCVPDDQGHYEVTGRYLLEDGPPQKKSEPEVPSWALD